MAMFQGTVDQIENNKNKKKIWGNGTHDEYYSAKTVDDKVSELEGITWARLIADNLSAIQVNYIFKGENLYTPSKSIFSLPGEVSALGKWYLSVNVQANEVIISRIPPSAATYQPLFEITIANVGGNVVLDNVLAYPLNKNQEAQFFTDLIEQDSATQITRLQLRNKRQSQCNSNKRKPRHR